MVVNAGVRGSLQNYHMLFSGVKLHYLTLSAVSGCTKSCICPGRLTSWASPWFSCLNRVCTCRFPVLECPIHRANTILPSAMLIQHLSSEKLFCQSLQCKSRPRAQCRGRRDPLLPEGRKSSRWYSQFESGGNTINPLGGYLFSKPKLMWVKTRESQGGGQDCWLTARCVKRWEPKHSWKGCFVGGCRW